MGDLQLVNRKLVLIALLLSILTELKLNGASCQTLQPTRDEFNTTELTVPADFKQSFDAEDKQTEFPRAIKRILLRLNYSDCCPTWNYLTTNNSEVAEELNSSPLKPTRTRKLLLKPENLLQEYKRTFLNVTYLSIDGQPGSSEREKYYNFLDNLQYFLRLSKLSREFIVAESSRKSSQVEAEFLRDFNRQLRTVEFKISTDPTLASFLSEFMSLPAGNGGNNNSEPEINANFLYYEDFLTKTSFGQEYARNVSLIRESVLVFEQIHSHLTSELLFSSNLTRPSNQYKIVQAMASELYTIRRELEERVGVRVRSNRQDLRSLFGKFRQLEASRSYIKMLGDFYTKTNNFGLHARKLTSMLDRYLANNMTRVTFYQELTELPEDFIVLGASIAAEYERREVPAVLQLQPAQLLHQHQQNQDQAELEKTQPEPVATARLSSDSSWVGMISSPMVFINRKLASGSRRR